MYQNTFTLFSKEKNVDQMGVGGGEDQEKIVTKEWLHSLVILQLCGQDSLLCHITFSFSHSPSMFV